VRIRIALSAILAVLCFATASMTLLGSTPALSAGPKSHHGVRTQHGSVLAGSQLASFASPSAVTVATQPTPVAPVAPTPAPVVAPTPAPVVTDADSVDTADWMCIRIHESGDRYNDPSEPSGAYGILLSTWQSFGYSGWPYQAAPSVQDHLALVLYSMYGFHPWSSRFACGL
jgi:hypothetical protein